MTEYLGNARVFEHVREDLQREADSARDRGNEELAVRLEEHADMAAADRDREQRFEEKRALNRRAHRGY